MEKAEKTSQQYGQMTESAVRETEREYSQKETDIEQKGGREKGYVWVLCCSQPERGSLANEGRSGAYH